MDYAGPVKDVSTASGIGPADYWIEIGGLRVCIYGTQGLRVLGS